MLTFLSVTAHPDDEILGFGGTSYALTQKGHKVVNCILSGKVDARVNRPDLITLNKNIIAAQKIIGADDVILADFPNIKFNTIPHLELVQFIEAAIEKVQPDYIITHNAYDLNNDHYHTSKACQAASRLFQRKKMKKLKGLYFMEVPSSTDWALQNEFNFSPDTFFYIGKEGLNKKIEALKKYEGIIRPYPHPRSEEALVALATLRGSQAGRMYCEGFKTAINIFD